MATEQNKKQNRDYVYKVTDVDKFKNINKHGYPWMESAFKEEPTMQVLQTGRYR